MQGSVAFVIVPIDQLFLLVPLKMLQQSNQHFKPVVLHGEVKHGLLSGDCQRLNGSESIGSGWVVRMDPALAVCVLGRRQDDVIWHVPRACVDDVSWRMPRTWVARSWH